MTTLLLRLSDGPVYRLRGCLRCSRMVLQTDDLWTGRCVACERNVDRTSGFYLSAPPRKTSRLCPHCRLVHDGRVIAMCPDRRPWSRVEKDERREQSRLRTPSIQFPMTFGRDRL